MKETSGNQETELCSVYNSIIFSFSVFLFGSFRVLVTSKRDNTVFMFHKHMTNRSQLFLSMKISQLINHSLKLMIT